jgi:ketosteroid isomerase-like protein
MSGAAAREDQELRALAESAYEALNARDLDRFLALLADDVEFTSLIAEAEGVSFRGRDGARTWWDTVVANFDEVHWEILEMTTGPDARGVVHFRITATMGGVPLEQTMWQATRMRDGKVSWWGVFRTEPEALEAAGLSE